MTIGKTLNKLSVFESRANLITFIEIFGADKGRKQWRTYKRDCNHSPLRFWRSLNPIGRQAIENYITKLN